VLNEDSSRLCLVSTQTMPADVLFQFNRADLKPSAAHALQQALQLITTQRVRSVIIEGHTDSIGSATQNPSGLGLSVEGKGR
jgi:outer membrane protein OmpA-like peptidoglycan-associated protein